MASVGLNGRRSSVSCSPKKFKYGLTVADRPLPVRRLGDPLAPKLPFRSGAPEIRSSMHEETACAITTIVLLGSGMFFSMKGPLFGHRG
jgi:hypothetical protein